MINAFLLSNQHNDYLENKVAYDLIFDMETILLIVACL